MRPFKYIINGADTKIHLLFFIYLINFIAKRNTTAELKTAHVGEVEKQNNALKKIKQTKNSSSLILSSTKTVVFGLPA